MINPDLLNGILEGIGSIFLYRNACTLYNHKEMKGMSIVSMTFFTLWAIWNCFYFPYLHQWISFWMGISFAGASLSWLILAIYYSGRNRRAKADR